MDEVLIDKNSSEHTCNPQLRSDWIREAQLLGNVDDIIGLLCVYALKLSNYGCGNCISELLLGTIESFPIKEQPAIAQKLMDLIHDSNQKIGYEHLSFILYRLHKHYDKDDVDPICVLDKFTNINSTTKSFELIKKSNGITHKFYKCLDQFIQEGLVDPKTESDQFINIFKNTIVESPVYWLGKKNALIYFIKRLTDEKIIVSPKNRSELINVCFTYEDKVKHPINDSTKWQGLSEHFEESINLRVKEIVDAKRSAV